MTSLRSRKSLGAFTLIELMVVIAIIGVIAAFAGPAYQNYLFQAKIHKAGQAASGVRKTVETHYMEHGALPEEVNQVGPPSRNQVLGLEGSDQLANPELGIWAIWIGQTNHISLSETHDTATVPHVSVGLNLSNFGGGGYARLVWTFAPSGGAMRWRCGGDQWTDVPKDILPPECIH